MITQLQENHILKKYDVNGERKKLKQKFLLIGMILLFFLAIFN